MKSRQLCKKYKIEDDMIVALCRHASSNMVYQEFFLLSACIHLSMPINMDGFFEKSTIQGLFKSCLDFIQSSKDKFQLKEEFLNVFLAILYDEMMQPHLEEVIKKYEGSVFEEILTIAHIQPLFLIRETFHLDTSKPANLEKRDAIATTNLERHKKNMRLLWNVKLHDESRALEIKKAIWLYTLDFASIYILMFPDDVWITHLNFAIDILSTLLEKGVKSVGGNEKQITLDYMIQATSVTEQAQTWLLNVSKTVPSTSKAKRLAIMNNLFRLADSQMSCGNLSEEKALDVLKPLLDMALQFAVTPIQMSTLFYLYRKSDLCGTGAFLEIKNQIQYRVKIVNNNNKEMVLEIRCASIKVTKIMMVSQKW